MVVAISVFIFLLFMLRPFIIGMAEGQSKVSKIRIMSYYEILNIFYVLGYNFQLYMEQEKTSSFHTKLMKILKTPRFNLPKTKFNVGDKFTMNTFYSNPTQTYSIIEIDYIRKVYLFNNLDNKTTLLEALSFNEEHKMNYIKEEIIKGILND